MSLNCMAPNYPPIVSLGSITMIYHVYYKEFYTNSQRINAKLDNSKNPISSSS